jgi:hypothetical protein
MSRRKDTQDNVLAAYQAQMIRQGIQRGMPEDQAVLFAAHCVAKQIELIAREDAARIRKSKPRTLLGGS